MSSAMDKALMAMSLEEEDIPFDMPNLPEFSSCERNVLTKAISSLADLIGQVKVVEFDPDKPQILPFVRVLVLFDISRPLRRAKVVNLPQGGKGHSRAPVPKVPFLKQTDLLFGILEEHQVGLNPSTGRQRIAPEVLEGMRQYVNVSNADEKLIRIERIKKSVREVESDPLLAKSFLQLESPPVVSTTLSTPKGIVFSYKDQSPSQSYSQAPSSSLIPSSNSLIPAVGDLTLEVPVSKDFLCLGQSSQDISTVYRTGCLATSSSGNIHKITKQRKRPSKIIRKLKQAASMVPKEAVNMEEGLCSGFLVHRKSGKKSQVAAEETVVPTLKMGFEIGQQVKRKAVEELVCPSKLSKPKPKEVIPIEGSPNV
ncbi:unnamed protein product [Arabidopsis halleri]